MTLFHEKAFELSGQAIQAREIAVLQVNLGYRCNQHCTHCHVSAQPGRQEAMDRGTVDKVLAILKEHRIRCLDVTGGAPELNPHFRYMIQSARENDVHVIVRTNLTVFFEPGMADIPEFFRDNIVEVIASLPCFTRENVDRMRGRAFEKSIKGLRTLNALGYGRNGGLVLNLVYNPLSASLPGSQNALESSYKEELSERVGITFNRLLVLANLPAGRFQEMLVRTDERVRYIESARSALNTDTFEGLMCRHLLNVRWDGTLYDCDFNQALGLPVRSASRHIRDFDLQSLSHRFIMTGDHCYLCTAGKGSS